MINCEKLWISGGLGNLIIGAIYCAEPTIEELYERNHPQRQL